MPARRWRCSWKRSPTRLAESRRRSAVPAASAPPPPAATAGTEMPTATTAAVVVTAAWGLGLGGRGGHPGGAGHDHGHFLRGGLELHTRGGGRPTDRRADLEPLSRAPRPQERAR